jgi:hypothetical protein
MHYEDFSVHVSQDATGSFIARVLRSPAGEGSARLELPFTAAELEALGWENPTDGNARGEMLTVPTTREGRPASRAHSMPPPQIGRRLYDALFMGQVGNLLEHSRGLIAADPEKGLRIKLHFDLGNRAAQFQSLPWELLARPDGGFVGLNRHTPIVRHLDVAQAAQKIKLSGPLRILATMASPSDLAQLDLARERRVLDDLVKRQPNWRIEVLPNASIERLRQVLTSFRPHIVHFMGHGGFDAEEGEGYLLFEGPDRRSQPISGQAFATKLLDLRTVGIVFLNACETARGSGDDTANPYAGVASSLVRTGIPAVVAMRQPISDVAAIAFSSAFYGEMAEGAPLEIAMNEARHAIHATNTRNWEWSTPVLFARSSDSQLFELAPTGTISQVSVMPTLPPPPPIPQAVAPQMPQPMLQPIPASAVVRSEAPGSRRRTLIAVGLGAVVLGGAGMVGYLGMTKDPAATPTTNTAKITTPAELRPQPVDPPKTGRSSSRKTKLAETQTATVPAPAPSSTETATAPPPAQVAKPALEPEPQEYFPSARATSSRNVGVAIGATHPHLTAKLTRVDRLSNGRLLIHLQLATSEPGDLSFTFDPSSISAFASDRLGVLNTSETGEDLRESKLDVPAGSGRAIWLEVAGDDAGPGQIELHLGAQGSISFDSVSVPVP